jgi:hypothetical protein
MIPQPNVQQKHQSPDCVVGALGTTKPLSRVSSSGAMTSVGDFHNARVPTAGQ